MKNHQKWLEKRGLTPKQIQKRKKELGSPYSIPDYSTGCLTPLSNNIPGNGTKDVDISKAKFCKENYAMVPSFNKGAIGVFTKDNIDLLKSNTKK